MGLLQFDTSTVVNSQLDRAVVEVFGEVNEGTADYVTTHLYAIRGAGDWDETTITWDQVDNLADSTGNVVNIADNFVTGVGVTAEFVGNLTFTQDREVVSVDITDFLLANPGLLGGNLRLMVAREVRVDGEDIDRSFGAVRFDSKDDATGTAPRLILELFANEVLLGDMNGNGEVNNLDIAGFALALFNRAAYNQMFPGIDPDEVGDFSGDGVLNNLDIAGFAAVLF